MRWLSNTLHCTRYFVEYYVDSSRRSTILSYLFLTALFAVGTFLELVRHVADPELIHRFGVWLRLVDDPDAGNEEAVVLQESLQIHADSPAGDEVGVAAGGQSRGRLPGEGEQVAHPFAVPIPGAAPAKRLEVMEAFI